ncbi:MAG: hypothetical protein ACJAWL_003533, partial [Motiliproteus sp.]
MVVDEVKAFLIADTPRSVRSRQVYLQNGHDV